MASKQINFTIDKKAALRLAKKAISGKFAIMKDNGFTLKVGAPMMTATIEIGDGVITVSGSPMIAPTVFNEIQMLLEEEQEGGNNAQQGQGGSALSMDDQLKAVEAIKKFKELFDSGIITEEEFETKKKELLSAQGTAQPKQSAPEQSVEKSVSDVQEEQPSEDDNGSKKRKSPKLVLILGIIGWVFVLAAFIQMLTSPGLDMVYETTIFGSVHKIHRYLFPSELMFGGDVSDAMFKDGDYSAIHSTRALIAWLLVMVSMLLSTVIVCLNIIRPKETRKPTIALCIVSGILSVVAAIFIFTLPATIDAVLYITWILSAVFLLIYFVSSIVCAIVRSKQEN